MGTRPFAAAQTMKYPMKCTRQPHAAMNLHPYWPRQQHCPSRCHIRSFLQPMHTPSVKLFTITSKRWDSSQTHLGANLCLSLRAS